MPSRTVRLMRAGLALAFSAATFAQTVDKKPVFEAAAIKPAGPSNGGSHWSTDPGRLTIRRTSLRNCIAIAYNMRQEQISGGPDWVDSEAYDIVAKLENPGPVEPHAKDPDDPLRIAFQSLLKERFQLAVHRETKTAPGYALVVAKGGLKIKPVAATDQSSSHSSNGKLTASGISMEQFASILSRQTRTPVEDMTGTPGVFSFELEWSREEAQQDVGGLDTPVNPPLLLAIQDKLGLKLELKKVTMEVLVVDRAEKPGEN